MDGSIACTGAAESVHVPVGDFGLALSTFEEVAEHLANVVVETDVVLDNSRSLERLVYDDEHPVTAIAVGGNRFSRA